MVCNLLLVALQIEDWKHATPFKRRFLKILRRAIFRKILMQVLEFSIELLRAEIFLDTSLKSDSITNAIAPSLKILETLQEHICGGIVWKKRLENTYSESEFEKRSRSKVFILLKLFYFFVHSQKIVCAWVFLEQLCRFFW